MGSTPLQPRRERRGVGRGRGGWRGGRSGRGPRTWPPTGRDVLLLEGSPQIGGKLRTRRGRRADRRRRRRGDARPPSRGRRPRPRSSASRSSTPPPRPRASGPAARCATLPRSLMGVPFDLDQLAASGVLSAEGLARARGRDRRPSPSTTTSPSATWWPPGSATRSSTASSSRCSAACTPATPAASPRPRRCRSCSPWPAAAACSSRPPPSRASDAPVFAALPGGMGRLPGLVRDGGGFEVRTSATVRALRRVRRVGVGRLTVGPTTHPETDRGGRRRARDARRAHRPAAGRRRAGRPRPSWPRSSAASVAVVTLAFRAAGPARRALRAVRLPRAARRAAARSRRRRSPSPSGLGARPRPRTSWSCAPRWAAHGEEATLQAGDEELVRVSLADLAAHGRHHRAARSTRTCSGGAARCRSTPSATSTGWRGSGPPSAGSRGSRSAGRRTTASASPP